MAFEKATVTREGINISYWKIISVNKNTIQKYVDVSLGGYTSKEDVLANPSPKQIRRVRVLWDKFDEFFGIDVLNQVGENDIRSSYKFAKLYDSFFCDAVTLD